MASAVARTAAVITKPSHAVACTLLSRANATNAHGDSVASRRSCVRQQWGSSCGYAVRRLARWFAST